jgi:hypothetical protein
VLLTFIWRVSFGFKLKEEVWVTNFQFARSQLLLCERLSFSQQTLMGESGQWHTHVDRTTIYSKRRDSRLQATGGIQSREVVGVLHAVQKVR